MGGVGWLVISDSDGVSLIFGDRNFRKILSLKKAGESDRGNSFKRLTNFFFCPTKKMVVSSSSMISCFFFGGGSKMEIWQHVDPPQEKRTVALKIHQFSISVWCPRQRWRVLSVSEMVPFQGSNTNTPAESPFELIVVFLHVPPSQSPKKVVLPGQVTTILTAWQSRGIPHSQWQQNFN